VWKSLAPCVENWGPRVENRAKTVEEWRAGCGEPVEEAVEDRAGAVDELWKACGSRSAVPGRLTE
jgi:hypothetical protein